MSWPVNFATLAGGNEALALIDAMFQQVAAMVAIPSTATGTNSITLAPIGNAPSSTNLSAYGNFNTFSFLAAATSSSSVTAQFGSLANLPVYRADGSTQATSGDLVSGRPYILMYASSLNSGGGGFYLLRPALQPSGGQATQQIFLTGTGATYTTPANCLQLRIRMVGGGGGGGGSGGAGVGTGAAGTATLFNAIGANPGAGGILNTGAGLVLGGAGGSGGAGAATLRLNGGAGAWGSMQTANGSPGGTGGATPFGSGGQANSGAAVIPANTGAGGGGGNASNATGAGGGGGSGEYVELVINNPVATYLYTVGAGGVAGTAGASGNAGIAGSTGIIVVEERYQD